MSNTSEIRQIEQKATAYVSVGLWTVKGDAFVIADSCNFQILKRYGDGSTGIFPMNALGHRKYDRACTRSTAPTIATVIGDGNCSWIAHAIVHQWSITNNWSLHLVITPGKTRWSFQCSVSVIGCCFHFTGKSCLVIRLNRCFLGVIIGWASFFFTGGKGGNKKKDGCR